jgi:hypothetical protein
MDRIKNIVDYESIVRILTSKLKNLLIATLLFDKSEMLSWNKGDEYNILVSFLFEIDVTGLLSRHIGITKNCPMYNTLIV